MTLGFCCISNKLMEGTHNLPIGSAICKLFPLLVSAARLKTFKNAIIALPTRHDTSDTDVYEIGVRGHGNSKLSESSSSDEVLHSENNNLNCDFKSRFTSPFKTMIFLPSIYDQWGFRALSL